MDKQSFDSWLQQNYPQLHQQLSDTDSLHDAYVIVIKRNPDSEEYERQLNLAYISARRFYQAYAMRFLLPDPIFWVYQAMKSEDDQPTEQQKQDKDKQDERRLTALQLFVYRNYTKAEYDIFSDFRFRHKQIADIAKQRGLSPKTVASIIEDIVENYKKHKYNEKTKDKHTEE